MRTMNRSTSLWIKGQNLSSSRVGRSGWMERKGKKKIQLVGDTPGQPLPQAQVGVQLPLPSPTESLDRKKAQASESRKESGGGAGGVGNGDQGVGGG